MPNYLSKIIDSLKYSHRLQTSFKVGVFALGAIATVFTLAGGSIKDFLNLNILQRITFILLSFALLSTISYFIIGFLYKKSIRLFIRKTSITIDHGDIFNTPGLRIIGCDTNFNTQVDDVVISKRSLHGQLVLKHGNKNQIKRIVDNEAQRLKLNKNSRGLYDFPLGTIIPYWNKNENQTYLMLALTELDKDFKAHTNQAKFESMLIKMWTEIDRVYAGHDVVLPLLGTGISRFEDGPKDPVDLLKCMLHAFDCSSVNLKSHVTILIYGKQKDFSLFEYRNLTH